MCSIFGVKSEYLLKKYNIKKLNYSNNLLVHRGPDEQNTYYDQNIFLGHNRLSIIDINNGSQPIFSKCKNFLIIYNGEIYNYLELQKKYNIKMKTKSDTELILSLYLKLGYDCFKFLDGMFAVAIYDISKKKLLLARDHFGIKPLYYYKKDDVFIFSSEIKAIASVLNNNIKVNHNSLSNFFVFNFYDGENTLYENIREVKQGSLLEVNKANIITFKSFFNLKSIFKKKKQENNCEKLFNETITKHLVSDVKISSHLSGGLDSSIISSIASRVDPTNKLNCYTGFFREKGFSELEYSNELKKINTNIINNNICISSKDYIDNFENFFKHMDYPLAGIGSLNQYILNKEISKKFKVALSGHGGDEFFNGYVRNELFLMKDKGLKFFKKKKYLNYQKVIEEFFKSKKKNYFSLIDRSKDISDFFCKDFINLKYKKKWFDKNFYIYKDDDHKNMTLFDVKYNLTSLLKIEDIVSMANSLETRVPIVNKVFINNIFNCTDFKKLHFKVTKNELKKYFSNYLPTKILNRSKMGFPSPFNIWLLKDKKIKEFAYDVLNSQNFINKSYFNKKKIKSIVNFKNLSNNLNSRLIWNFLSLELTTKKFKKF